MLKKLSLVTLVLVILGSAAYFFNQKVSGFLVSGRVGQTLLKEVDSQTLAKITIQAGETPVELEKNSDQVWIVKNARYAADPQKIQELLVKLLKIKLGDLLTENAEQHTRFQVLHLSENNNKWEADKTGKILALKNQDSQVLLELVLGKDRTGGAGQYVRYAGEKGVYLIPEFIRLETTPEEWLQTMLTNLEGRKLAKSIHLQRAEQEAWTFERAKEEDPWTFPGLPAHEKVEQEGVGALANALTSLRFNKLVPATTSASATGREKLTEFKAELFDGRIVQVQVGEQEAGENKAYYATLQMKLREGVSDQGLKDEVESFNHRSAGWMYALDSWMGKRFLKERKDLIGEAPVTPATSGNAASTSNAVSAPDVPPAMPPMPPSPPAPAGTP